MAIWDELRLAIRNSGRTQRELGEAIGVHELSINRFVNGRMELSAHTAEKLAIELGVKLTGDKRRKKRK